jgi:cbb3-type cytochrome oxidase subunit 3
MKLSDIMGNAGLSGYAEVALVIFLLVFLAIIIRTWAPSRQQELRDASMIPLNDEPVVPRSGAPSHHGGQ